MLFALLYAAVRSACAAAPDILARFVALIYAAACAVTLNGIAMCFASLYVAMPSAGADAPGQLATTMCCTLVYASVCGTGTDAAIGLAILMRHALLYSFACRACVAAVGSHTRYVLCYTLQCA